MRLLIVSHYQGVKMAWYNALSVCALLMLYNFANGLKSDLHHIFSNEKFGDLEHDCINQEFLSRLDNLSCKDLCYNKVTLPGGSIARNGTCFENLKCKNPFYNCCRAILNLLKVPNTGTYMPFATDCACQMCTGFDTSHLPSIQDIFESNFGE